MLTANNGFQCVLHMKRYFDVGPDHWRIELPVGRVPLNRQNAGQLSGSHFTLPKGWKYYGKDPGTNPWDEKTTSLKCQETDCLQRKY